MVYPELKIESPENGLLDLLVRTSPKFCASDWRRVAPFPRWERRFSPCLVHISTFPQSAGATTGYLYRFT